MRIKIYITFKILKRCSLSTEDLLHFYFSVVRPILEYACPVWHTSLTKEQTCQIEHIQKRAMRIIFDSNCIDYEHFCCVKKWIRCKLAEWNCVKKIFRSSVLNEASCLHGLLPAIRADAPYALRHKPQYIPQVRTSRFSNSFIMFGLRNYL